MALEKIGLGAVFTFDGAQGIAGMKAAQSAVSGFGASTARAFGGIGPMAGSLALLTAPLAAAVTLGFNEAAKFEQQMGAVAAVSGATGEEFKALERKAKDMGNTTAYSATQAGQAMEYLARNGFSTKEVIGALDGVLAAAAADGMDLAAAADITSNVLRSMHLEASQAARVADVLALVSSKTNTNIRGLGGAFRYAAAQAVTSGIDFETTSAILGVISDSGLDATAGGTAFTNMLVQLSRPTKKASKMMNELGAHVHEFDDGTQDVVGTVKDFNEALSKIQSRTKRAQYTTEIFGVRGQKAYNALAASLGRINPETGKNKLEETINAAYNAQGSAATMAERRLGVFLGTLKILKNTMKTFAIETMGQFLGPMSRSIKVFTGHLQNVVGALMDINEGTHTVEETVGKFGQRAYNIATGINAGIAQFKEHISWLKAKFLELADVLGAKLGPATETNIAKLATMTVLYAGLLSPVLGALRLIAPLLSGLTTLFFSAFGVIAEGAVAVGGAITWPILAAIAVIMYAWYNARDQMRDLLNQVIEIFIGVWNIISESAMAFWNSFMEQARPAIDYIVDSFRTAFHEILSFLKKMLNYGIQVVEVLKPLFVGMFEAIGWIAGKVFQGIAIIFGGLVQLLKPVFDLFAEFAKFVIEDIVNALMAFVRMIVRVSDAVNINVPKGLREFGGDPKRPLSWRLMDNTSQDKPKDYVGSTANELMALTALGRANGNKAAAAKPPKLEANVQVENKNKLDIHNCMKVDGREIAVATGRVNQETQERAGFKATRWQQKFSTETGTQPIPGGM